LKNSDGWSVGQHVKAVLAALLMLGLCQPAQAQVDDLAAAQNIDSPNYYEFTPPGWGFPIYLTDWGSLTQPGDPDWDNDPKYTGFEFLWKSKIGNSKEPVFEISASTSKKAGYTQSTYEALCQSTWEAAKQSTEVELLTVEPHLQLGERSWYILHAEGREKGQPDKDLVARYICLTLDEDVVRIVEFRCLPYATDDAQRSLIQAEIELTLTSEESEELEEDAAEEIAADSIEPVTETTPASAVRTLGEVAQQISASSVTVETRFAQPKSNPTLMGQLGTGVVLQDQRYVLTSLFVLSDAKFIRVITKDGHAYKAEIIGSNPQLDLAVLKIDWGTATAPPAPVFASDLQLRLQQPIAIIGKLPDGANTTALATIITKLPEGMQDRFLHFDGAQFKASYHGAPIIDARGQVIGLACGVIRSEGNLIDTALPIDVALENADRIIASGP
jgi:hypothetical protein